MERHKNTITVLRALARTDSKTVKLFVTGAQLSFINSISEICYNILHGNVSLTEDQIKKLKKHKTAIYKLSSTENNIKRRYVTIQLIQEIISIWPNVMP